ncbi:XdhC family aldehyde oxidoreductase maturation factor [Oleidesulfovibrio sp.]|uniref:XdhC family aldehyde oxidoreductase maturation factor n=1 Tax=Oleidesulfovibrio sp. TaxID=2909707 RepID=UPI003A87C769
MNTLFSAACRLLRQGEHIVFVTIALQSGSTPRESGAKMIVRQDGSIMGTVGGGLVEAQCMVLGQKLLNGIYAPEKETPEAAAEIAVVKNFDLTNEEAAKAAMVCGGRLTVVAQRISPDAQGHTAGLSGAAALEAVHECLSQGVACGLSTELTQLTPLDTTVTPDATETCFAVEGYFVTPLSSSPNAITSAKLQCSDSSCRFVEQFSPQPRMIIFGAGHVAQPTAHLAAMTGFAVTVLDDRPEFANEQRFPEAKNIVLPDFEHSFADLTITPQCYIVIMTRGHLHDKTVLEQALQTPATYIGMIGSRRKRDTLYERMRNEGVTDEAIARCHCPIGLDIGGQTPEEIAVSIMAEVIRHRAQNS